MKNLRQGSECNECEHKHTAVDEDRGEVYCEDCFLVLESNRIDYSCEYQDKSNTSVTTSGSSVLDTKKREMAKYLQRLEKKRMPVNREYQIKIIFDQTLGPLNRNYDFFRNNVKWVYERLPKEWSGKTRDVKVGAISYVLAKAYGVDLDPETITKVCHCREELLQKNSRKIAAILSKSSRYKNLMNSEKVLNDRWLYPKTALEIQTELICGYCSERSLPEYLSTMAVENMKDMKAEIDPEVKKGVGAAHLVVTARRNGVDISLNDISKFFDNERTTIRNRMKEINHVNEMNSNKLEINAMVR